MWQDIISTLKNALIMNWPSLIYALILITLLIIGAIFLCKGLRAKNNIYSFLGSGLITLSLLSAIVNSVPDFGTAILAFATLVLAVFTGFLVIENRALREQDRTKTEHSRRESQIKELVEWAIDAANGKFEDEMRRFRETILHAKKKQYITEAGFKKISSTIFGRSAYMVNLSTLIDPSLKPLCEILEAQMWSLADNILDDSLTDKEGVCSDCRIDIYEAANDVIEKATKLLENNK